jgi:hypothetical protein
VRKKDNENNFYSIFCYDISDLILFSCSSRFVGSVVAITYMALLYVTFVPDWEYQISGPGSTEQTLFVSATSSYYCSKKSSVK